MRCLVVASQAAAGRPIAHQPAKAGRRCRRARLRVRGLGTSAAGSVYPVCLANDANVVLGFTGNGFAAAPLGGCGLAGSCENTRCSRTGAGAKLASLSTSPEWE